MRLEKPGGTITVGGVHPSDAYRGGKSISLKYEGLDFKVSGMQVKKLKIDGVRAQAPGAPVPPDVYDEATFAAAPASETEEGSSGFEIEGGLPFDQVDRKSVV